jgi:hypothetical protein
MSNINKTEFVKSLETLFFSSSTDCPDEVILGANELLNWFENQFGVKLNIRFERDEDFNDNFEEVFEAIMNC